MNKKLENKVAVITGGARGIGRDIALTLAAEGASLVIVDIVQDNLDKIKTELQATGCKVLTQKVDVTQKSDINRMVAETVAKFGQIDILINNAAYIHYAKFLDYPEDEWDKVMGVSLKGYFLCGQAVAREMVNKKNGSIINIASIAGEIGVPLGSAYCTSKGGVISLTKLMATELAQHNIRVNAIAPGVVATENVRQVVGDDGMKLREKMIPLGRLGQPEDIARAALFLASDDSGFITGDVMRVDGGVMAAAIVVRD